MSSPEDREKHKRRLEYKKFDRLKPIKTTKKIKIDPEEERWEKLNPKNIEEFLDEDD